MTSQKTQRSSSNGPAPTSRVMTFGLAALLIAVAFYATYIRPSTNTALAPKSPDVVAKPSSGIKLFGFPPSTCTRRVALILKEKKVDYELVTVDFSKREHKSPDYLENMQPFGVVPVLEDNGFFIYESRAISRYIAERFSEQGTQGLFPPRSDVKAWAMFEQAASVEQNNFDPYASGIASERVFKGANGNHKHADKLLADLYLKMEGYERVLSKQRYLAGPNITLADLFHLPYGTLITERLGLDVLRSKPNVARWWDEISSRPSWIEVQKELTRT